MDSVQKLIIMFIIIIAVNITSLPLARVLTKSSVLYQSDALYFLFCHLNTKFLTYHEEPTYGFSGFT